MAGETSVTAVTAHLGALSSTAFGCVGATGSELAVGDGEFLVLHVGHDHGIVPLVAHARNCVHQQLGVRMGRIVHDFLDGCRGDRAVYPIVCTVGYRDNCYVFKLVAALVAELLRVCLLDIKHPPGLLCRYGDLVALLYRSGKVAVVDVDRAGSVNEDNARGNHTGSVGDLCYDTLDLDLCALCSVARVGDGHRGVSGFVDGVVLEFNDIRALDLKAAVVVLYRAEKLYGIVVSESTYVKEC